MTSAKEVCANYKSINKIRAQDAESEVKDAGYGGIASEAWCLHASLHADAEKTELGNA